MVDRALATFAAARARPVRIDALAALLEAEPALAEVVTRIVALADLPVPPLVRHVAGQPACVAIPRAEVATWVARILCGRIEQPPGPHPLLDAAPLLGSPYPAERAKLRCVLAYFERVASPPPGVVEIERVVAPPPPADAWRADASPLAPLEVVDGAIEDAPACRQVDFANAYLGGGVLSGGNVQEEIRFAIAPELLAAMIVSPPLRADEAIVMRGAERFAATRGYGHTFAYVGPHHDRFARLPDGTPDLELVAIDALDFRRADPGGQYAPASILRELGKARAGFRRDARNRAVATGNWGCGVFLGDPALKAIVQWLAASAEGRAIRYFPFGDRRVAGLAAFARGCAGTVGELAARVLAGQVPDLRGPGA